jgi:hypothetical protein
VLNAASKSGLWRNFPAAELAGNGEKGLESRPAAAAITAQEPINPRPAKTRKSDALGRNLSAAEGWCCRPTIGFEAVAAGCSRRHYVRLL